MSLLHRAAGFGLAALLAASPAFVDPALAQQKMLRIAMTAADVPTTTGAPNNGFEGVRFLGYPAFEGLVLWDLSRADRPGHAPRRASPKAGRRTRPTRRPGSSSSVPA